jgi:predicted SnoaL-like aldol condensation-catalyzing enzyme
MEDTKGVATSNKKTVKSRKDIAVDFLRFIGSGRPKEGLHYFAPNCTTHNPYVPGDMNALTDAMVAVQEKGAAGIIEGSSAEFKLIIIHVLAEEDLVAVHTQLTSSNPDDGGLRQVHLFRFEGDSIVEYWDITQLVPENAPNAAAAFS